MRDWI